MDVESGYKVGGLLAWSVGSIDNLDVEPIVSSYWDKDVSNIDVGWGGAHKATTAMMTPSTYAGWDMKTPFDNDDRASVWLIYPVSICLAMTPECMGSYPFLSYQNGWNIETSSISHTRSRPSANSSAPIVSIKGKTLSVKLSTSPTVGVENFQPLQIRMIDLRGKTVSSFNIANMSGGTFSLSKIPAGRYIVEVRQAGARLGSSAVMVR
jgi:hypothetical protein